MAERIADNAELIVDEMRRKARRRLVGAIVLALAAAIILPMLLEKDPRPLGDDVSVQIPPIDQGKFVNRLTGKTSDAKAPAKSDSKPIAAAAAKAETKADAATEPPASAPKAEATAQQESAGVPKTEPAAAPKVDPAVAATLETKGEAKSAAKADVKPPPSAETRTAVASAAPASAATSQASTSAAAVPKPEGGFVVQLAAFADDKGANALANKLKKGGYAAYVEPVNTSRGTLWRVRVGGYGTRPEADAARVALKGEGYSGIIAPSQ
jgi:DedD protein